ncbi:MAG TPA: hypothetical protein VGA45_11010, partial [Actinomycetota bacterium]
MASLGEITCRNPSERKVAARVRSRGALQGAVARLLDEQHRHRAARRAPLAVPLHRPWVTLAAGFTYLFLGFQYHDAGYTLGKAVAAGALGAFCYLCYALPASYLGSRTGQTHSLLTRSIFGLVGSAIVSLLLIGVAAGWTAFAFNLLATMYDGLFSWGHVVLIGVILAVVGIFNNL